MLRLYCLDSCLRGNDTKCKMANNRKQNYQPDPIKSIFIGIFRAIWWLIKLPFKVFKSSGRVGLRVGDKNYLVEKRLEIEKTLNSGNDIELKHALIEADKLVDHALKLQRFFGETFADRLRSAEKTIDQRTYQAVWQGHKVRNQIVHEQGNDISDGELRTAVMNLLGYIKGI